MPNWNSRGLRGSTLEELINMTNESYITRGLGVIQKIPTPITPIKIDSATRTITLAYFEQKSTVDYIGVIQGVPICFDAKSTTRKMLPLQNIHEHQIKFMESFQKQKGVSFLIVYFQNTNEYFYLPFETLIDFWSKAQSGGRKSIPYDAFDKKYIIANKNGFFIHYLEPLSIYLSQS